MISSTAHKNEIDKNEYFVVYVFKIVCEICLVHL